MPDTPSITIVKRFTYRDLPEEWSNTYHFSGTTPADNSAWKSLADAIIAAERPLVGSDVKFIRAYGYQAGNEQSVFQISYEDAPNVVLAGSGSYGGALTQAGDAAMWARWKTDQRNSKGRAIYLRKYFHGVAMGAADKVTATQVTALQTYAAKMKDGTLPGGAKICGPQGAVAGDIKVSTYVTFRQLKRTGKRPH